MLPSGSCATGAPDPAEGVQAWVTNPAPAQNSIETLCVRLITGDEPVSGATATGVAHYKSKDTSLGLALTGSDAVAQIDFDISRATIGYTVFIDVTVGGQTVRHTTSFTPQ
jgi:hypothetical protein